ncbi:MAG: glycosyltransferase family 2 protein [Anaerolineae bacterium]
MKPNSLYPLHVVILNWNLPEETILCVESVQLNPPLDVEIIVVDNGSTDRSVELFQSRLGDTVRIIENSENLGFAAGINVGIRRALTEGAHSILLLNNDTIVDANMICHLVSAAIKSPQAGIIGPIIYYYDRPERIWRFGDREYRWLPVPLQLPASVLSKARQTPFRVDYVTACGMLVRRQVFEAIGLFDTRYFMYFEDADFCRRARQAGYEIWCAPQARMWHKVSLSASKQKPATRYAESWGRAQFYQRHPHGFSRGLTFAHLLVKSVMTTLRDALSKEWELIKPQWMGMLDGHYDRPSRVFDFFK